MRLNLRLARLERRTSGDSECSSCGWPTDGSKPSRWEFVLPLPPLLTEVVDIKREPVLR